MKKIVIFNQKVAGYLALRGFVLKKIERSHHNPHLNVFIFNDTKELRKAISEFDNFISHCENYSQ